MAPSPMRRLKSVAPKPGYRLSISWEKGGVTTVGLSPTISIGGVFSTLSDNTAFSKVRIGENQRTVEWPEPSDVDGYPIVTIDADALFCMAQDQESANLEGSMRRLLETLKALGKAAGGFPKGVMSKT